ncbi:Major facilitator superfamily domain, general substrate transporter [Penicillium griseofulvum]|uniref:Major facilitator superfamily domain, general substrate transporter n=1 Tax=Penicillium patulum TaxID=5078 RepID=A0A135LG64_PENPA|nr:Major facilitator superfamily domain, general substrate transporter [Penicillium griseofulvum]KXG47971.1 Major facilitator superfamily domain, general substrate transporter [Penicillium griseofulvum]
MAISPSDSTMKMDPKQVQQPDWDIEQREPEKKRSGVLNVVISGLALFSDGYNAQIIGYMEPLFSVLYMDGMSSTIKSRLSNSYLIGEIFGMLFFGVLIDRIGRRTGIVAATAFLIIGVVLATASHGKSQLGMFWMMIVARGIAGFGAGGEYPVCATSATEAADETVHLRKRRGFLVALTTDFAIDLGFVAAGLVALIVLACYSQQNSEGVWRITFGLGIVLPLSICFFRVRMVNSTQYRKHAIKSQYPYGLVLRRYWKPMLGTSLAWFCYDFVTYPFGLFSSTIIEQLSPHNSSVQNIGYGNFQTVINCFYLPGCLLGGILMDRIGRKQTMTLGFLIWAIWGFILGAALHPIQSVFPLFVVMYGIFQALGEMGPGVSTFLCASESFPTPLRGHFLGFAAAVGKAGASIGTEVFTPIQNSFDTTAKGQQAVFLIGSAFTVVGGLVAWFLIPDMSRELETEDAKFKAYLEEQGYDVSLYGEALVVNARGLI